MCLLLGLVGLILLLRGKRPEQSDERVSFNV
jgi:hypothetical protein